MPRRTNGHAYPRLDWFGDDEPPPVTFRERRLAIAPGMPAPRDHPTLVSSHHYHYQQKHHEQNFFHRPRPRRLRYHHHHHLHHHLHHGAEPRMEDRTADSTVSSVCVSHAAPPRNAAALTRSRSANGVRMSLPPAFAGYPLPKGVPTIACVCDTDAPRIHASHPSTTFVSNIGVTVNSSRMTTNHRDHQCRHNTASSCTIPVQVPHDDLSLSKHDVTSSSLSASGCPSMSASGCPSMSASGCPSMSASGCPSMSASSLHAAITNPHGATANSGERATFRVERPRLISSSSVSDSEDGYVNVRTAFVEAPRQNSLHKSVKNGMQHFVRCTSKLCPHPVDID